MLVVKWMSNCEYTHYFDQQSRSCWNLTRSSKRSIRYFAVLISTGYPEGSKFYRYNPSISSCASNHHWNWNLKLEIGIPWAPSQIRQRNGVCKTFPSVYAQHRDKLWKNRKPKCLYRERCNKFNEDGKGEKSSDQCVASTPQRSPITYLLCVCVPSVDCTSKGHCCTGIAVELGNGTLARHGSAFQRRLAAVFSVWKWAAPVLFATPASRSEIP